jgi:phosphonate transport system ATP-binding protein
MTVLSVTELHKVFPDGTRALDGVSLSATPGEVVALLGSNGSGKSTLLRCIVGLEHVTSGTVCVCETDIRTARGKRLREARRQVGMVFQGFHLVGNLSSFHNVLQGAMGESANPLRWWPATAPEGLRRRAMESLERVGLAQFAARRADALSGGQQQRVAIARMLMQDPKLVLADEPVASLDPRAGREVMDLLAGLSRERGIAVVCALHQLDFATAYADRYVGLVDGRVALDGPANAVDRAGLQALYGDREERKGVAVRER